MDLKRIQHVTFESASETKLTGYSIGLVLNQLCRMLEEGWVFVQSDYRLIDLRDTNVRLPPDCLSRESKMRLASDDPEMDLIVAFAYAYSSLAHQAAIHCGPTGSTLENVFNRLSADHRNFHPQWFPQEYHRALELEQEMLLANISGLPPADESSTTSDQEIYRHWLAILIRAAIRVVFGPESEYLRLVSP